MTPEEAIPRTAADAHNDLLYENIGRGTFPLWFTAKETAEIAKAYLKEYLSRGDISSRVLNDHYVRERADDWEDLFKEWSK